MYGEYLVNAQGEDVVAGIRTPQPVEQMREILPEAYDQLLDTMARLEQHYRDMQDIEFTVEDGTPLPAADALGEAHRRGRDQLRRGHGGRGTDQPRGGDLAHRSGAARPAAAPDARPERRSSRWRRSGLNASPGAACGEDRVRRRHGGGARQGRRAGDPRPLGDDPGRHPRADPGEGRPHRARRHDVARGGRRARHGQAVRRGLRGPEHRRGHEGGHDRRPQAARGRHDHDRRRHRPRHPRRGAARPAADQRGLRDDPRAGPTRCAGSACARTRDTPEDAREGARVRRRGHRPLSAPSTCSSARSGCRWCRR